MKRKFLKSLFFVLLLSAISFTGIILYKIRSEHIKTTSPTEQQTPVPTPTPEAPTPIPTPKPLTFSEMNALYGPCVKLPTLMYHHVEPVDIATAAKHQYLNVAPETFRAQLQYLSSHGYRFASISELVNFFNNGTPVPAKSVLLTFDDGYADFSTYAAPILSEFNASGVMYLPTGLVGNPDYMTWDQVKSLPGIVTVNNHTWSHKNMGASYNTDLKEITTADTQLNDHGLNNPKTFAYPYGIYSKNAETILQNLGYQLAFTTKPGNTLCKQQRFSLPRIRIGNGNIQAYGF